PAAPAMSPRAQRGVFHAPQRRFLTPFGMTWLALAPPLRSLWHPAAPSHVTPLRQQCHPERSEGSSMRHSEASSLRSE
ncbi:hypothetical protein EYB53_012235, partial [Candidatus Chloroploca sp. M-50]